MPYQVFFMLMVVSILLYGCTTWTLTKRLKKKLDGNYTRMLRTILNKSWWQHPTKHQLHGHLPPITKTIQVRWTRHAGHCWRSKDELSDVLLWTPVYGQAKAGRPALTYIQQLCEDMGCSPEDLLEAMNDREKWRERVRDIRAGGTTWWWPFWHQGITWQRNFFSFVESFAFLCLSLLEYKIRKKLKKNEHRVENFNPPSQNTMNHAKTKLWLFLTILKKNHLSSH